jgi:hypothetical protein
VARKVHHDRGKESIPEFHKNYLDAVCDVLSVDGLHTAYNGAIQDVKNFQEMAHDGAVVFIDDNGPTYVNEGLYSDWKKLIAKGDIE